MTDAIYSEVRKAKEEGHRISVSRVLELTGVSSSGYYDWCKRKPSSRELNRLDIQKHVMSEYEDSHKIYGAKKITRNLNAKGIHVSERTVTRYMHEMGIHAWYRRPYTLTTASIDFTDRLKNLLKREFSPSEPNAVWCTDITYIHTQEGFLYLSCIMDLFSRRIVAWELGKTLETEHVIAAVKKAIQNTGARPKVIHTDRGVQYTSDLYEEFTAGISRSYSSKGNPWDNACIESFHALIKREWLWRFKVMDYHHAHRLVFEYIDAFYNTIRIHSHCDYLSPAEYEKRYYARLKHAEHVVA
ncbi:MAG: IS3 family transposase [Parasporobacterium sp.]|nr:IS3 family transposase [Parasporobacterium sp.]